MSRQTENIWGGFLFEEIKGKLFSIARVMKSSIPYIFAKNPRKREVTEKYPDPISSRMAEDLPERSRGLLVNDIGRCTGCGDCVKVCPANCISLLADLGPEEGKNWVTKFVIDYGKCIQCGICVEICEPASLAHSRNFEGAATTVEKLAKDFGRGVVTPEQREKWALQRAENREEGFF